MKKVIIVLLVLASVIALNSCKKKICGCMNPTATNYNSNAEEDDGSCVYHYIGESYGGGIIFYLNASKNHGFICTTTNQSNAIWGSTTVTTLATGSAIGTGQSNTTMIVSALGPGNYAAYMCDTLVSGGFSDWFLPSIDELDLLYIQKVAGKVSGFANEYYWSSTEYNTFYAWNLSFGTGDHAFDGSTFFDGKNYPLYVRAIRAF